MTETLSIAGLSVEPGRRLAETVTFQAAGVPVQLPLFLINGAQPGPTLVITAGIHGAEYPCVEAASRLGRTLEPQELAGQMVIAPLANPVAFAARSIYVSPPDGKNLNRQFPGKAQGTFSEALAHWLLTNIIGAGDAYIDLHGGDMIEALMPFGCVVGSGQAEMDAKAAAMAQSFGLPYIVLRERRSIAGTTHMAAADAGIPALLAEAGGQGLLTEPDVQLLEQGCRRVMASLGMTAGPDRPETPPRKFEAWSWLRAEHHGLFYPDVVVGQEVKAGQPLGRVATIFGETLQPVEATMDGAVLFLVTSLAMNQGDPLLAIAG